MAVSPVRCAAAGALHTYQGSCMPKRHSRQCAGTCSRGDAVRMMYADSWIGYHCRGSPTGCWFDSLLWGLGQGLLAIQQREPQGWEALLLTSGKGESEKDQTL